MDRVKHFFHEYLYFNRFCDYVMKKSGFNVARFFIDDVSIEIKITGVLRILNTNEDFESMVKLYNYLKRTNYELNDTSILTKLRITKKVNLDEIIIKMSDKVYKSFDDIKYRNYCFYNFIFETLRDNKIIKDLWKTSYKFRVNSNKINFEVSIIDIKQLDEPNKKYDILEKFETTTLVDLFYVDPDKNILIPMIKENKKLTYKDIKHDMEFPAIKSGTTTPKTNATFSTPNNTPIIKANNGPVDMIAELNASLLETSKMGSWADIVLNDKPKPKPVAVKKETYTVLTLKTPASSTKPIVKEIPIFEKNPQFMKVSLTEYKENTEQITHCETDTESVKSLPYPEPEINPCIISQNEEIFKDKHEIIELKERLFNLETKYDSEIKQLTEKNTILETKLSTYEEKIKTMDHDISQLTKGSYNQNKINTDANSNIFSMKGSIQTLEENYQNMCNIMNQYYEKVNSLETMINNNIMQHFVPPQVQQVQQVHPVQHIPQYFPPPINGQQLIPVLSPNQIAQYYAEMQQQQQQYQTYSQPSPHSPHTPITPNSNSHGRGYFN